MASWADERFTLANKRAVVTGGTKGIGAACVDELAQLGAKVFMCSRSKEDVQKAVAEYKQRGLDVQGCAADISSVEGCRAFMDQVSKAFDGRLDFLVCNAGMNIRKKSVEYSSQEYETIMNTNLHACFHLAVMAQPMLKSTGDPERPQSCVIFITSVGGGPTAMYSGSPYAMTKAAVKQLTRNLACEWAAAGIRVNDVAPGYILTPLTQGILEDCSPGSVYDQALDRIPQRRISGPEGVSGVVAFLCSAAALYVTGQTLAVDGGYSIMGIYPKPKPAS